MAKHGWLVVVILVSVVACSKKDGGNAAPGSGSAASAPAGSTAPAPAPAGSAPAPAPAGSAAAAPSGSAAPAAGSGSAVAEGFKVGDAVYGQWTDGDWYPGKIGKINDDGTYRVNYNDGDVSPKLTAKQVKPRKSGGGGGGGGGGGAAKSGGSEPCPGTGWTRCGNNCYLLSDDRYNCGACGHSCPSNMTVCRHGVCDCTGVEKDSNGGVCPP